MFDPKFTYNDKIVSNLIKIENLKTYLQTLDLNYDVRHRLTQNAKALDIFHLAHALGVELTLKDAEKIATGMKIESIEDERYHMLVNFRNALEFNRSSISDTYAEMDATILLHLNKLILTSWRESWESRFRNVSDSFRENEDWLELRDTSIQSDKLEESIQDLVEWYKNSFITMPFLVRIMITLFRLIQIAPFVAGNKLTILAFADYLLLKNGLSSKAFISTIRNFDSNSEKYLEAFKLCNKNFDTTYWLETFTTALTKDLMQTRESISSFIADEEKSKKQPFLDLNKRQLKILRYLQNVAYIKREDYCHMMEVSTMTAFRDLNELVRKKLVKIDGQGRGTKYRLSTM